MSVNKDDGVIWQCWQYCVLGSVWRQYVFSKQRLWLTRFGRSWVTCVDDGKNRPWRHWRVDNELVHRERDSFERKISVNEERREDEWQKHNGECSRSEHAIDSPRIRSFIHLCQEYQSFKKYLPLMQQQIIMINIVMTTKGPAGINIFKFDSALARHWCRCSYRSSNSVVSYKTDVSFKSP